MNGVLVVDKPTGPTSHDVVARVRRAIRVSKVGHTGTLDPLAGGVLPLVIGRATRLAALLSASTKEYVAGVRFGASTPTYDAESLTTPPPEPPGLTAEAVEAALREFHGTQVQTPPPYSAKKIGGVAAYKRARSSEPVAPKPVSVTADSIILEEYAAGHARVRLSTSAGFYVRSFAHDLGRRLGCGAYLASLCRTRAGDFTLDDAVGLDAVEEAGSAIVSAIVPMERLLLHLPGIVLTEGGSRRASHGNALRPEDLSGLPDAAAARLRLLDTSGALLGIAEPRQNGLLHPVIVLV